MKFKRRSDSPLKRKASHGFRGYPLATVAFYGPDDQRAGKVAVGVLTSEEGEPVAMERWFDEVGDIRHNPAVAAEIQRFVQGYGVKSVVMPDHILGCPHEEGIDYPDGEVCPQCPFWAPRDRWTGETVQ